MIIIKVGGSAFSDKKTGTDYSDGVFKRVASELPKNESIILLLGAGYTGHSIAMHYKLSRLEGNALHWAYLRYKVSELAQKLVKILLDAGFPAIYFSAISSITTSNGAISDFDTSKILKFAEMGFLPVMHSDAPADSKNGISIVSSDRMAVQLANASKARLLLFGTDVDGIYDKDRNVIKRVSPGDDVGSYLWKVNDVSGGIANKLSEARHLTATKAVIINLRKDGSLSKAISGGEIGTVIS
ncbi:MAG: isopentenyl phosphate kinase [Candidatus Micrarchaeia archaeon]